MKKKTIKAWALISDGELVFGTACEFDGLGHGQEYYSAVFESRRLAIIAKQNHPEFYRDSKIKPVEISYQLNTKQ